MSDSRIFSLERNRVRYKAGSKSVVNVMSIDLEDWFQVTNFELVLNRSDWDQYSFRLLESVPRLLDLFAEHDVRATFFTLGWVAERYPLLIKRISDEGHEIASHGYEHRLVTSLSPVQFRQQLVQSKDILEQILGEPIHGHRAPSYSFRNETKWAIKEMIDAGFLYDSSIFPYGKRHDRAFCDSKFPCLLRDDQGSSIMEYPLSIVNLYGMDMPIAGGGYFRLLPYKIVKQAIEKLNSEARPAIMYFHPWEIDPGQPRVHQAPWLSRFRHYHNLEHTENKIRNLIEDFRFVSFRDFFWNEKENKFDAVIQI